MKHYFEVSPEIPIMYCIVYFRPQSAASQNYNLPGRFHNLQMAARVNYLNDSNASLLECFILAHTNCILNLTAARFNSAVFRSGHPSTY